MESNTSEFTGKFCWEEIEGIAVPFIIRSSGEMLAEINMLKKTLYEKQLKVLSNTVFNIACPPFNPDRKPHKTEATELERKLLTEINAKHCDHYFTSTPYSLDTFLLRKDDVVQLYQVLDMFCKFVRQKSIVNPNYGYILIDESNTPVPFVDVPSIGMVVPLFFFECPAVMNIKFELRDHWSLVYLKLLCKLLSILNIFYDQPTLMVVKLHDLKDIIPEASQFTFITTLPSNARVSELAPSQLPEHILKSTIENNPTPKSRKRTVSKPESTIDTDSKEVIKLSEPDEDAHEIEETITIEIEQDVEECDEANKREPKRPKRKITDSNIKPNTATKEKLSSDNEVKNNSVANVNPIKCHPKTKTETSSKLQKIAPKNTVAIPALNKATPNTMPMQSNFYGQQTHGDIVTNNENTYSFSNTGQFKKEITQPYYILPKQSNNPQAPSLNLSVSPTLPSTNAVVVSSAPAPILLNTTPQTATSPLGGFLLTSPTTIGNTLLQSNMYNPNVSPSYVLNPQTGMLTGLVQNSAGYLLPSGLLTQPAGFMPVQQFMGQQPSVIKPTNVIGQQQLSVGGNTSNSVIVLQQQSQNIGTQQSTITNLPLSTVPTAVQQPNTTRAPTMTYVPELGGFILQTGTAGPTLQTGAQPLVPGTSLVSTTTNNSQAPSLSLSVSQALPSANTVVVSTTSSVPANTVVVPTKSSTAEQSPALQRSGTSLVSTPAKFSTAEPSPAPQKSGTSLVSTPTSLSTAEHSPAPQRSRTLVSTTTSLPTVEQSPAPQRSRTPLVSTPTSLSTAEQPPTPQKSKEVPSDSDSPANETDVTVISSQKMKELIMVLKTGARETLYKVNEIPEHVSLQIPLKYKMELIKIDELPHRFLCISSAPFGKGSLLINISDIKNKLFEKVDKKAFMTTASAMKLEIFSLNSAQRAMITKYYESVKRPCVDEYLYFILNRFFKAHGLMKRVLSSSYS